MFVTSLTTMITLFLCILVGLLAAKQKIITPNNLPILNNLLLKITMPIMMVTALNIPLTDDILISAPLTILFSFIYNGLLWGLAILFTKLLKVHADLQKIWIFSFIFSNVSFIGFPLVGSIFGADGLVYVTMVNVAFNILVFSLGIFIISPKGSSKLSLKSIFTTPAMIGIEIGLILLFSQLVLPFTFTDGTTTTRLPLFISSTLQMIGNMTPPLAMIIVGVSLSETNLKKVILDKRLHIMSILKLLVAPLIIYVVTSFLINDPIIIGICTIMSGLPTATLGVILSQEYKQDYIYASEIFFITTIYSMITIPILFLILF